MNELQKAGVTDFLTYDIDKLGNVRLFKVIVETGEEVTLKNIDWADWQNISFELCNTRNEAKRQLILLKASL